jgi:integrase
MFQTKSTVDKNSRKKSSKKTAKETKVLKEKIPRMSDITDIYDGDIRIFRTTKSGDVFQLRMWISEEKKYIRKTLRTRDKQIAISLAQKEYISVKAKMLNGEKIFSPTAEEFKEKYLEYIQNLVDDKQISEGRQSNIKTFTKHYVRFVGKNTKIQGINPKFFLKYREFRQKELKTITMTVVVNESITIKQMYKWAMNEGLVSPTSMPDYGRIKVQKNEVKREGYSISEYNKLIDIAKKWYEKVPKDHPKRDEEIYYRRSIRDFIVLMANYGFRTGELLNLKVGDVEIHSDETATVTIRAETTKVRKRRDVRGRRGDIFSRRLTYSMFNEKEDFVFSHFNKKRQMSKDVLYDYFSDLLDVVKEKNPDFDTKKTIYSLRHFWITLQLIAGRVDVYKVARYAGTSLQQIQRHYDNMKDAEVSKEVLSFDMRFDKNNNELIVLDSD